MTSGFDEDRQAMTDISTERQAIDAANSRDAVNDVFRRQMRNAGFTAYAVGFLPDAAVEAEAGNDVEPFLLIDWPARWLELYARRGFAADDIVVAEAARTSDPFTWSEVCQRYPGASEHIFAAARDFGWGDGFVVPVHDPAGRAGERFGVASLAAPHLDGFGTAERHAATMLSLAAFARARLVTRRGPAEPTPVLSGREKQVLALVAEGHGDAEIGERLRISRATAHFHVESAKRRLEARTRTQAVAIALTRGLI